MTTRYVEKLRAWRDFESNLLVLEINPKLVDVIVHVQEEWNEATGINRESGQEYTILGRGTKLSGNREIRRGTMSHREHIRRFEASHQQKKVVAFAGNGNLLFNPWFVAWVDGKFFHLKDEPFKERLYSSLIVWKEGHDPLVSIGDIKFENGRVLLASEHTTDDITDRIKYAASGQRLAREHKRVKLSSILHQFYDLRHLLPALYYSDAQGAKYAFGLDQLQADEELRKLAVMKQPVDLRLEIETISGIMKIDPQKLKGEALLERGFDEVQDIGSVQRPGQYFISPDGRAITVIYRSNIYPHHMMGITEEGKVLSVIVTGLSGRVGISIEKASQLVVDIGLKDAILLSNGGDVVMQYFGEMVVASSENRHRSRSLILFAKNRNQLSKSNPCEMGIRLVKYPPS